MSNQPKVSVIIAFLNAEHFLVEAIESVFAQTFRSWELLLIDDGSSDSSSEIARRYTAGHPHMVKYLEHHNHRNRGLPASRNLGIRHAKSEYIAVLDSDDVWLPGKLEHQTAVLDSNPEAGLVSGATEYWQSWNSKSTVDPADYVQGFGLPTGRIYAPPVLLKRVFAGVAATPCPSNWLFRKELIANLGGFEESFIGVFATCEDLAFLAKVYANLPVFLSGECLDRYRLHSDSLSAKVKTRGQFSAATIFYLSWAREYLASQGVLDPEIEDMIRRMLWPHQHPLLNRLTQLGPGVARKLRRLRTGPPHG